MNLSDIFVNFQGIAGKLLRIINGLVFIEKRINNLYNNRRE